MSHIEDSEALARESAKKRITEIFKDQDQLDKIESIRAKFLNQKLATEAQLRMVVHRQLDEAQSGLNKLDMANNEAKACDKRYSEMEIALKSLTGLPSSLNELRNLTLKYNQLVTAKENMNTLIKVDELTNQAKIHIENEDFLDAHKIVQDLEAIQDDLMYEVEKTKNLDDVSTLKSYFKELGPLNDTMLKKIVFVGKNIFNAAISSNHLLVSIVRVIDREERIDAIWQKNQTITNFLPAGRLKKWKSRFFDEVRRTIYEKVNYCNIQNDEMVQTFELIRVQSLMNIKLAKNILVTYFPPDYEIFNTIVSMYHDAIAEYINDVIDNKKLDRKSMSSILMFLKRYLSSEFMGDEYLNIDLDKLTIKHPIKILKPERRQKFYADFVNVLGSNCDQWMKNSLNKDVPEWSAESPPNETGSRKYYTTLPVMVNQVFTELMGPRGLFRSMDPEIPELCYPVIFDCLYTFSSLYHSQILNLQSTYYNAKHGMYYSEYVIANLYNSAEIPSRFLEIFDEEIRDKPYIRHEYSRRIEELKERFSKISELCVAMTIEQIFVDLKDHFDKLMTREWLQDGDMTHYLLSGTLTDYNNLWVNMPDQFYDNFIVEMGVEFLIKYILSIINKRIVNITLEERQKAGKKIISDGESLQRTFEQFLPKQSELLNAYNVLKLIGKLIESQYPEFDVINLINDFPDIKKDMLKSIVLMRGEIKQSELQNILQYEAKEGKSSPMRLFYRINMKILGN